MATLSWVHWHNTERLHGYLGDVPPDEFEAAFYSAQQTTIPAGSRLTRCRCVPVCARCGTYKPLMGIDVTEWPMGPRYVERVIAHLLKDSGPGTIALTGDGGDPVRITEDGVTEIIGGPNPGGWAEFGYTDDGQERAGR